MSTVEKETGETIKNVQDSNPAIKQEVLGGDDWSSVKQEGCLKRKKEQPVTLKRKKKKSSDGETEVGPTVSKEGKTFNWRNHQLQTAINVMNCKIVSVLTSYRRNNVRNSRDEEAVQDSPYHRVSHKKIESGVVQLPSLDVPSDWILKNSYVER